MMNATNFTRTALGAAFAAAMLASAPALALEPKQCLPLAEMNNVLKAEGQRSLIVGNREAIQNPTGHAADMTVDKYANIVTANADGSLGYQLEGDLPRAQPSTSLCVRGKLTNVRLLDARKPGPAKAALLGGNFDRNVYGLEAKGTRAALVADTFMGNDTSRRGNPLVVFYNEAGQSGSLTTNTSQGPKLLAVMGNVEYTPEAIRRLDSATQVALNVR